MAYFKQKYTRKTCESERIYEERRAKVDVFSDNQTISKVIASSQIRSKLVWVFEYSLNTLTAGHRVTLKWAASHGGMAGNEEMDALGKKDSQSPFV